MQSGKVHSRKLMHIHLSDLCLNTRLSSGRGCPQFALMLIFHVMFYCWVIPWGIVDSFWICACGFSNRCHLQSETREFFFTTWRLRALDITVDGTQVTGRIEATLRKKDAMIPMVVPLHKKGWTCHSTMRTFDLSILQWNLKDVLLDNERRSKIMIWTKWKSAQMSGSWQDGSKMRMVWGFVDQESFTRSCITVWTTRIPQRNWRISRHGYWDTVEISLIVSPVGKQNWCGFFWAS